MIDSNKRPASLNQNLHHIKLRIKKRIKIGNLIKLTIATSLRIMPINIAEKLQADNPEEIEHNQVHRKELENNRDCHEELGDQS